MSASPVVGRRRASRRPAARTAALLLPVASLALSACDARDDDFLSQVRPFEEFDAHASESEGDHYVLQHMEPMTAPDWVPGAEAAHMLPTDPVVGYVSGELAWALPWWIMNNYHVANLTLDGEAVCIILCEMCSSAAAWDPIVDGRRLHLRVNGLYNGTICCIDDETGTWWTPFLGEGMSGPLKGTRLKRRRVDQATWADWLELHPATRVATAPAALRQGHGERHIPGTAILGPTMGRMILHPDARLPKFDLVLGVDVGGAKRAYPMSALDRAGTFLEDTLGGREIVVFHKPGTYLAAAFLRTLDGKELRFTRGEDGAALDSGTGSRWNAAGVARDGPLAGRKLDPVVYAMEEWYSWATQHPGTSIHGVAE